MPSTEFELSYKGTKEMLLVNNVDGMNPAGTKQRLHSSFYYGK